MNTSRLKNVSLECTHEDAERNHLRDGLRMSADERFAFFEDMLAIAAASGALERELNRRAKVELERWVAFEREPDRARATTASD